MLIPSFLRPRGKSCTSPEYTCSDLRPPVCTTSASWPAVKGKVVHLRAHRLPLTSYMTLGRSLSNTLTLYVSFPICKSEIIRVPTLRFATSSKGVKTHEVSGAEPGTKEVVRGVSCPSHRPPPSLGLRVSGSQPMPTSGLVFSFQACRGELGFASWNSKWLGPWKIAWAAALGVALASSAPAGTHSLQLREPQTDTTFKTITYCINRWAYGVQAKREPKQTEYWLVV